VALPIMLAVNGVWFGSRLRVEKESSRQGSDVFAAGGLWVGP
jgi:hypothetical protein